ncbi:MAG: hypothetical protein O3B64_00485 [bacterium]|nr:hypothetical protein [bacterium]
MKKVKTSLTVSFLSFTFLVIGASVLNAAPYAVSDFVYSGDAEIYDYSDEDTIVGDIEFNNDGSKMFLLGANSDSIIEYSLSTPYVISTATHAGVDEELYVSAEEVGVLGFEFNDDGSKVYVIGNADDSVVEYGLATPFDLSTASYSGIGEEYDASGEDTAPADIEFNDDGSKMFFLGRTSFSVIEYTLSTPYDVSTAVHAGGGEELDVSAEESSPWGIEFNANGSALFVVGSDDDSIVRYTLTTPYDVSSATYDGIAAELDLSSQTSDLHGMAFNASGSKFAIVGADGYVLAYHDVERRGTSYSGPSEPLTFDIDLSPAFEKGMLVTAGAEVQIDWTTEGTGITQFVNLIVEDVYTGDQSYIAKHIQNTGSYSWMIPADFEAGYVIAQSTDLASVMSEARSGLLWDASYVEEDASEGMVEEEYIEPTAERYGRSPVTGELELIDAVQIGDYIVGDSFDTVYYIDVNMMRRPFMDRQTYFTWQDSYQTVIRVTDATLTSLTLGAPMLPKSDTVLITIPSIDTVYVLTSGEYDEPMLRELASEEDAALIYGQDWADYVIDVPLTLWTRFTIGDVINSDSFEPFNSSMMKTRTELNS